MQKRTLNSTEKEVVMRTIAFIALIIALTTPVSYAQTSTTALGECLAKSTSGADREHFAKWIFSIMAKHPEAEPLSDISEGERERIDSQSAMLLTRLITEDCSQEARTTARTGGQRALMKSFKTMGEIAMQEIFRDESVIRSSENYLKYLDDDIFADVFQ